MLTRLIILPLAFFGLLAASPLSEDEALIRSHLQTIEEAALSSNFEKAEALYDRDFVLVSQSGSVYAHQDSLFDLGSGFDSWDNSEVRVDINGDAAIVILVNTRQREGLEPASFRVMQVWRMRDNGWKLTAQASARIKQRN